VPAFENSSNIASADYDPAAQKLTVTFRNGGQYAYAGVPQDVFNEMKSAESVGSYFHTSVRGAYEAAKIEPEPVTEKGA